MNPINMSPVAKLNYWKSPQGGSGSESWGKSYKIARFSSSSQGTTYVSYNSQGKGIFVDVSPSGKVSTKPVW